MKPVAITAYTLVSALGGTKAATLAALRSGQSGLTRCDFAGVNHGYIGRVAGVETHALPPPLACFDCRNNRLADMALHSNGFADAVDAARVRLGDARIAVVVGTSTSGILSAEEAFRRRDPVTGALPAAFNFTETHETYSLPRYVRAALNLRGPALSVAAACASAAKAIAHARELINAGVCDAAVAGGADSLCRMTLRGFASLELVSPAPCRPCAADRAGLSIGEAAGFLLLQRGAGDIALLGAGSSSDGHHMSAPQPDGAGAASAMNNALTDAGLKPSAIDYIHLHGTGTKANDEAEDAAVVTVFGKATACASSKGGTGHTLGAAGVVGAVIAALSIRHGMMPGCFGLDRPDARLRGNILTRTVDAPVRRVMTNAFGFGGVNCSLLFGAA